MSHPAGRRSPFSERPNPLASPAIREPTAEPLAPSPVPTSRRNSKTTAKVPPTSGVVTVDQVYRLLEQKDKYLSFSGPLSPKSGKQAEIMDLPGMQEARSKIAVAKGRDQIMLVDNFSSMDEHKTKAMKTARVISYVAKIADDNGMELFAASETTKRPRMCKNSTQIEKAVGRMKTVKGKCDMQKCLGDILDRVLVKATFRPTSIYIYTDGVWEPGDDRVEVLINRAIDFLDANGYKSSALMFQFIRFGSDPTGTERLEHLDNECKKATSTDH
ncbi:hypothetical protein IL306_011901 [Fusarium sp. DS 682]|nr:hypothetical protein IL306_011901 [Fusarium sp. DS 682]